LNPNFLNLARRNQVTELDYEIGASGITITVDKPLSEHQSEGSLPVVKSILCNSEEEEEKTLVDWDTINIGWASFQASLKKLIVENCDELSPEINENMKGKLPFIEDISFNEETQELVCKAEFETKSATVIKQTLSFKSKKYSLFSTGIIEEGDTVIEEIVDLVEDPSLRQDIDHFRACARRVPYVFSALNEL
jgi:hypothetical protein